MSYKVQTTEKVESSTRPGVKIYIRKMTEGRRLELRSQIAGANAQIREIIREQDKIMSSPESARDMAKYYELADKSDELTLTVMNPAWIKWGCAKVEGLELEGGEPLGLDRANDWPSDFYSEVLDLVKEEAQLNGAERKNSQSSSTSGGRVDLSQKSTTAESAKEKDTIGDATVGSTSLPN